MAALDLLETNYVGQYVDVPLEPLGRRGEVHPLRHLARHPCVLPLPLGVRLERSLR